MTSGNPFLDRLNHPIFGTFIGSWVVWNWEIFYYLGCGVKTPAETISYVNSTYLYRGNIWGLTKWPLLATLIYLYGGPILKKGYDITVNKIIAYMDKRDVVNKSELLSEQVVTNNLNTANQELQRRVTLYEEVFRSLPVQPIPIRGGESMEALEFVRNYHSVREQLTSLSIRDAESQKIIKVLEGQLESLMNTPAFRAAMITGQKTIPRSLGAVVGNVRDGFDSKKD